MAIDSLTEENAKFIDLCMNEPYKNLAELGYRWQGFSKEERSRALEIYLKIDREKQRESEDIKYESTLKLWRKLDNDSRNTLLDEMDEDIVDDFCDYILDKENIGYVDKRTTSYKYLESLDYSPKDIAKIYLQNKYFCYVPKKTMEKDVLFFKAIGIPEEMLKNNPLLLAKRYSEIYAKMKFYERVGENFTNITQEQIELLVETNSDFEREWGEDVKNELAQSNPELYETVYGEGSLKKRYRDSDTEKTIKGLVGLDNITDEIFNKLIEDRIEEIKNQVRENVSMSGPFKLKNLLIMPPSTKKAAATNDVIIVIDGEQNETENENSDVENTDTVNPTPIENPKEAPIADEEKIEELLLLEQVKKFRQRLIDEFGEEYETREYRYSMGGTKNPDEITPNLNRNTTTTYLAFTVKDYTILEPVGQYGNATYVVPNIFLETLTMFSREEIRNTGIGFRLNHEKGDGTYNYSSDHLFDIIDCLKTAQEQQKTRITGQELIESVSNLIEKGIIARQEIITSPTVLKVIREAELAKDDVIEKSQEAVEDVEKVKKLVKKGLKNKKEEDHNI